MSLFKDNLPMNALSLKVLCEQFLGNGVYEYHLANLTGSHFGGCAIHSPFNRIKSTSRDITTRIL